MRKVKSESWLGRMGLVRDGGRKKGGAGGGEKAAATVGVLAFEVARFMSKAVQLWHALADDRVSRLRDEVLRLEGVRKLVSDDDGFLLALALAEMTDALGSLARAVAGLGRRCSDPALQRFDAAFADLVKTGADPHGFEYAGRKMERKIKKMERFVAAGADLYHELEVLAELEQGLLRLLANPVAGGRHQVSVADFKHKVLWQRQQVKYLREASLWVKTYDYAVRLLSRSLFSIVGRIRQVFGFPTRTEANGWSGGRRKPAARLSRSHSIAGLMPSPVHSPDGNMVRLFASGPHAAPQLETRSGPIATNSGAFAGQCPPPRIGLPPPARKRQNSRTKWPVGGRTFGGCMVGGNEPAVLQSCIPMDTALRKPNVTPLTPPGADAASTETSLNMFDVIEPRFQSLTAQATTLGAAALALHYANVIIVIEKLAASPHLIGPDARDDLYSMLTTSIKAALRARLKSYAKNLASSIYDPVLAAEWSAAVTRILEWLAPLAHNMIRWQSERNFEQQSLVSSSNVLLLQTLYFADQRKAEDAITELLVGLNYLWRYGRELNAKAMLECVSSRNFDDCLQIQVDADVRACPAIQDTA
ncbi:hypothetical protein OPV22_011651 [Ensete ventricosum]|uniref:DUF668 domain-containing protein n=1 Tax=Ensete ventricosum TaxID=4639 RepID=A0AAV8PZC0_ENSVE|nr:hypothetical protein OPV22_011651 [Ensete ventricosum]RZS22871.1 hypothetical protein BHM03_00055709 [Ensete ventricosum]